MSSILNGRLEVCRAKEAIRQTLKIDGSLIIYSVSYATCSIPLLSQLLLLLLLSCLVFLGVHLDPTRPIRQCRLYVESIRLNRVGQLTF